MIDKYNCFGGDTKILVRYKDKQVAHEKISVLFENKKSFKVLDENKKSFEVLDENGKWVGAEAVYCGEKALLEMLFSNSFLKNDGTPLTLFVTKDQKWPIPSLDFKEDHKNPKEIIVIKKTENIEKNFKNHKFNDLTKLNPFNNDFYIGLENHPMRSENFIEVKIDFIENPNQKTFCIKISNDSSKFFALSCWKHPHSVLPSGLMTCGC